MANYTSLLIDVSREVEQETAARHHERFMHEQHAIYASYTNYFGVQTETPAGALRQIESLQQKEKSTLNRVGKADQAAESRQLEGQKCTERTPLLYKHNMVASSSSAGVSSKNTEADDMDDIPKKKKHVDIWFTMYSMVYVFYLVLGSLAFESMEVESEVAERQSFRDARQRFLQKYSNVLDADLEQFIQEVVKVNGHGVSPLHNATSELNWSFGQALFFSTTVITTIGYGHVTPLTQSGKAFCILYAVVGIPLTLVLLSAMVERLLVPAAWLLGFMNSRMGHIYEPFNIRVGHLSIIVILFVSLYLIIPALVFAHFETSWTFLDAFYYCFISLTTIGLGDLIPGDDPFQENRSLYKIFTTVYLILGLVSVMLCLTIFYDIPQLNLGQLFTETSAGESEAMRLSLSGAPCYSSSGPSGLYIPHRDDEVRRSVVRIRPRGDKSPSPDEERAPRDIRVP